jgi:hypothetical protein
VTPARPETTPHDYRVVCEWEPAPIVVGGQAVNLWAINYLHQVPKSTLVSKDLDIVVGPDGTLGLKRIPGWLFEPNKTKNWTDSRLGFLRSTSPDGRPLLVEVLHSVHGLEKADLKHAAYVKMDGVLYRALDPVTILKAKAANVRDIDQGGAAPRHDRPHLHLIAQCVPPYLREVHALAVSNPAAEKESLAVISRAFKTLQHARTAVTLQAEGIAPAGLMPAEFADSPLPRVRAAFEWQYRLLPQSAAVSLPSPGVAVNRPDHPPRQGPRMGM